MGNKGQAMLLAVLLIGSGILTMTAVSGYLTLQRVRMSSDTVNSTKAVFAADAGIECELFNYFKRASVNCGKLFFEDNKVSIKTSIVVDASSTPRYIKSIGSASRAYRAFMMGFGGATSTLP
ncbi:MAG: hypothetical protein UU85_C0001G0123 [Candidatus Wolfebacteria bacterium GW2011_GWA2_42_10]|nr:MAG: hypothetical protein UU85_C0001G0123 [Candidatus Wolfebacteria bacterium GW2011_GWA2_42_10]